MKTFNAYKYQHGLACLSDQLLGQQLAHLNELGYPASVMLIRDEQGTVYGLMESIPINEHTMDYLRSQPVSAAYFNHLSEAE